MNPDRLRPGAMRPAGPVLLLLAAALAGCAGEGPPAAPGIQFQDDTIAVQDPAALPRGPPAPGERTLQEAPRWRLGEWWRVRLDNQLTGARYEFTRVVAGSEAGRYLVGFPVDGFSNDAMVLHVPGFGDVAQADLSYEAHDAVFKVLDFPLEDGKSWEASFLGTPPGPAIVHLPGDGTAVVEAPTPSYNITAVYDPAIGELRSLSIAGYAAYTVLDHGYGHQGLVSFTMPWGDVYSPGSRSEPSHHYPPAYPVYLGLFYLVFGFSEATTRVASIASALLAILVTYACTRNLYGHRWALTTAAIVAISPLHILATTQGYSENLLLAMFAGTLWAILRSLRQPAWILLAGLLAGLSYLTRSSMGPFFLLAGLAGLAWRIRWHGVEALRNPWYLAAIGVFATCVVAWGARNWRLHGTWQTSQRTADAFQQAWSEPMLWTGMTLVCLVFLAVAGYLLFLGLLPWPHFLKRLAQQADEHDSALLLAVVLPLFLAAPIHAALWMHEGWFFFLNVRYVAFAIVPAAWLVLPHADFASSTARRGLVTSAVLLCVGAAAFAFPREPPAVEAADALRGQVEDGDSIAFVGVRDVYRYYFDATDDGRREVAIEVLPLEANGNVSSDWAVSHQGVVVQGPYRLHGTYGWTDGPMPKAILLWERQEA